jgi:hypothetical protein
MTTEEKTTEAQNDPPSDKPKAKKPPAPPAPPPPTGPHVYRAISEVKDRLARYGGITKDRRAEAGGTYMFRGIDDMYNHLCPLTADAGLVMIPRVVSQRVEFEPRAKGGFQTHVFLMVEIDFVSDVDGSKHTGAFVGEAIDTSDKASNKAMSAAMKYACLMAFQIPTHGESDDTENHHHQIEAPPAAPAQRQPPAEVAQAIADKILAANDFGTLYKVVDAGGQPTFDLVARRTVELITEQPTIKALEESKPVIEKLGRPKTVMDAYAARYKLLRNAGSNAQGGAS